MTRLVFGILKSETMVVVTVNGCFDILHAGHVRFLKRAKMFGDYLIVLVNNDDSVKRLKGADRPINTIKDRVEVLRALACVNEVVVFGEDTPLNALNAIQPAIHVKGGSYIKERVEDEKKLVESWGGKLAFTKMEEGYSSTKIINKAELKKK